MSHYDLYVSLGLDRSAPTSALAQQLDERIEWARSADPAQLDELSTARAVLGTDAVRQDHDRWLSVPPGPDNPELTVDVLRQMAANASLPPPQQPPYPAPKKAGKVGVLPVAAMVIAGLAVGVGIGFGASAVIGADDGEAEGETTEVEDEDQGRGFSESDLEAAEGIVEDMLEQDSPEGLASWAEEHLDDRAADRILDFFAIDGTDPEDFREMGSYIGEDELGVGEATAFSAMLLSRAGDEERPLEDLVMEMAEPEGYTTEELMSSLSVPVLDPEDRVLGVIGLTEVDGDYRVIDVATYPLAGDLHGGLDGDD
ncbi:MAG: hypothetical protein ACTH1D_09505 [Mycobacteriaceae bacterium]|uniref:hypothetical protein n=1 Tax=Corynebacterium sp. TaxID=1720 RepID=UPI003F96A7E3